MAEPEDSLHYQLTLRNTGSQPLPERTIIINNNKETKGVLVEDKLSPYIHVNTATLPRVIPEQATLLVKTLTSNQWQTVTNWDKKEPLSHLGLHIPAKDLAPGQSASLSFNALINNATPKDTVIKNSGAVTDENNTPWLTSNEVQTQVISDGNQARGELHFMMPTERQNPLNFHDSFTPTGYYSLQNTWPEETENDVYLELIGGGFRLHNNTTDFIDVLVTSHENNAETTVRLIATTPGGNRFRSQFPLRLSTNKTAQRYCGNKNNQPNYQETNENCYLTSSANDDLIATVKDPHSDVTYGILATVTPQGKVFNAASKDFAAIAGAKIEFFNQKTFFTPEKKPSQKATVTVYSDSKGLFNYPKLKSGNYFLRVTPPDNFVFPSHIPKTSFNPTDKVIGASYGWRGQATDTKSGTRLPESNSEISVEGLFQVISDGYLHSFNIPLDPKATPEIQQALLLTKKAKQTTIAPGELVGYEITLSFNKETELATGDTVSNIIIEDKLPLGFKYMKGSARLNGQVISDPEGGAGPVLSFPIASISKDKKHTLTYALKQERGLSTAMVSIQQSLPAKHPL